MFKDQGKNIEDFYKSPLGQIFFQQIFKTMQKQLSSIKADNVLVLGPKVYGMEKLEKSFSNVEFKSITGSTVLPISDNSFDLVIVLHSIEFTEHIKGFMREVWRVTSPEGKALFLIPNRLGFLVRSDQTPFGYGQPFSKKQFKNILSDNSFNYEEALEILCMPVWTFSKKALVVKTLDDVGQILWPQLCGAYLYSAKKQVLGLEPKAKKTKVPIATVTAAS